MASARWIVRLSDQAFLRGGYFVDLTYDPATETLVELGEVATQPDPRLERYDATAETKRRAATAAEVTAHDDALASLQYDADPDARAHAEWWRDQLNALIREVNVMRAAMTPPLAPLAELTAHAQRAQLLQARRAKES
jgi:hypothetical protein